jgi:anti-sigma factor RsiW
MDRFDDLLNDYLDGTLDARGRAELAALVDADPDCLDAFVEVVSEQRIRRLQRI